MDKTTSQLERQLLVTIRNYAAIVQQPRCTADERGVAERLMISARDELIERYKENCHE